MSKKVEIDGKIYPTLKAACEAFKIPYGTVANRVRAGMSVEEALKTPKKKRELKYLLRGVWYSNLETAAKQNQCSHCLLPKLVNQGMTPDEALDHLRRPYHGKREPEIVDGVEYKSRNEAMRAYGIGKDNKVILRWMRREGLTFEQAILKWARQEHKAAGVTIRGVAYESIAEARRSLGFGKNAARKLRSVIRGGGDVDAWYEELERNRILNPRKYWGPYSKVATCRECGKLHKSRTPKRLINVLCMGCQAEAQKRLKKKQREARRMGLRDARKHTKRAKQYKVPYEHGITVLEVAIRGGLHCQVCGDRVHEHKGGYDAKGWTIGHIVALSAENSPGHIWSNVQCECHECNNRRHTKSLEEYEEYLKWADG